MIKVLGHRGCAGLEPENTIRAFRRALNLRVDLIEFDVRMTKDKKLIIIHDEKLDRTTNGCGFVKDFNFAEIRKFDAGKEEKIPLFEEALDFLKNEKPTIVIEIKEPESTEKILEIIAQKKLKNKVLIVSFWHNVLKKIKELETKIKTGAILAGRPINPILIAREAKTNLLCLRHEFIDEALVKDCHKNDIKINAWTVNEPEDIERMIKLGVDIISSDYPDRVLEKLKQEHLSSHH
jgi:glycerophosphoryl diester phosphodiesterase